MASVCVVLISGRYGCMYDVVCIIGFLGFLILIFYNFLIVFFRIFDF